jgi:hypothetical protein
LTIEFIVDTECKESGVRSQESEWFLLAEGEQVKARRYLECFFG